MSFFPEIDSIQIEPLISRAADVLNKRDFESFRKIIADIWNDIEETPDFSKFRKQMPELIHLAGEFLIHYGKTNNLRNYQERGKDLLTNAIDIFFAQKKNDKALNSQIVLAFAYYQQGSNDGFEAYLLDVESQFRGNRKQDNFLKLQINLLICEIAKSQLNNAKQRISTNLKYFNQSENLKLKTQFYNESGIAHRKLRQFKKAHNYFEKALELAQICNILDYQSIILNNFANTYRNEKKWDLAFDLIDKALSIAQNFPGLIPHYFDTKANIYLDFGDVEMAQEYISKALEIFRAGDNLSGLCDALFTEIKVLIALDWREDALIHFVQLYNTATDRIGNKEAMKYAKEYLNLCPSIPPGTFYERLDNLKRQMIETALNETRNNETAAAKQLGISRQSFNFNLNRFPHLAEKKQRDFENKKD